MNKDEILQMPAGQDMDLLIADHVLKMDSDMWNRLFFYTMNNKTKFSTDMSCAWMVVEKLCGENGCDIVKVCKRDPELLRGEWSCNFGLGFEAFGETAPLAICRAALLARCLTQRVPDAGDSAE